MGYKLTYEELDTVVRDWFVDYHKPVSVEEVSTGPPTDAPKELVCKEQSHHDFDRESST